jgi:hypothetical protein
VPDEVLDALIAFARRAAVLLGLAVGVGCSAATPSSRAIAQGPTPPLPAPAAASVPQEYEDSGALDATDEPSVDEDAMALHTDDADALRTLMGAAASVRLPIGGPWHLGQGNPAISHHAIGRRTCLEGLRDVVVQTPAQYARCAAGNMVPVWSNGGSEASAAFCIDVFEFPNRACELPFVFVTPSQALALCRAQGKRLCSQDEWNLACRGDPAGVSDRVYAYGDELDLTICNTNKSRANGPPPPCDVSTSERLWRTCGTNTEPSGAFPRCRSRFGVFDQHGNVAEIMTRFDAIDGEERSQLKGSAFFYVEVAKKPTDPGGYKTKYPDHCNFDPRWHVEKLAEAGHMNYHLGFRCCKSVDQ